MNNFIFIAWSLLILSGCGEAIKHTQEGHQHDHDEEELSLTEKQYLSAAIQLGTLTKTNMGSYVECNGIVEVPPQYKASIAVPLGGFIRKANLLVGDHVHKGDVMAIMYHPDYIRLQQSYLEEAARYNLIKKELARQQELAQYDINSKKSLEEAEADESISMAKLKALESQLQLLGISPKRVMEGKISSEIYIKAPISGDISVINVETGKYFGPQDVLFEIINKDHVHLELRVYEKDVNKIHKGQSLTFSLSDEDKTYTGDIHLIGKTIDPLTRSVLVHAHPDEYKDLLHGMYVKARVLIDDNEVLAFPEEALHVEKGQYYVFKESHKEGNRVFFSKIPVRVGKTDKGKVEIREPLNLKDDSSLVVKGAYVLTSTLKNVDADHH